LISDNELGLTNAVNAENYQLCILHAVKYLLFTLWGDGVSKDDRLKVESAFKTALFALVNSTKKHLQDGDHGRLQRRIRETQRALEKIARRLEEDGYVRAADFIFRNGRFMVTFAQLALEDIRIPYTTNRIERLMGEISKRCKHKWMHWSTQGLKDILTIILVRYTNRSLYEDFKKAYIHNSIFH
jgi:transposase-like protein